MVDRSDISILVKSSGLNKKPGTLATKAELKAEQDKIIQLQAFDSSYFHRKSVFDDDGFQIKFVYQLTFNALELKKDKGTEYVNGLKSKGVYNSKFTPLHGAFLPNIK